MSYFGDCRDFHYATNEIYKGVCCHSVHGQNICVWGHVRCSGKNACIKQVHAKTGDKCPHY